jgi:hypothetical protein
MPTIAEKLYLKNKINIPRGGRKNMEKGWKGKYKKPPVLRHILTGESHEVNFFKKVEDFLRLHICHKADKYFPEDSDFFFSYYEDFLDLLEIYYPDKDTVIASYWLRDSDTYFVICLNKDPARGFSNAPIRKKLNYLLAFQEAEFETEKEIYNYIKLI